MPRKLFIAAVLMLLAGSAAQASNAPVDPEALQRLKYTGPNGVQVTVLRYADQNWTEVDPNSAMAAKDTYYKEVCFEGKFESYWDLGLKLTGVDGKLLFEDKAKRKSAPDMKPLDNVWVCGTLQPSKTGAGQDLMVYDVFKLPPDAQRFQNKFDTYERNKDVQGLVDLGLRIEQNIKSSRNGNLGFIGHEGLLQLRDKAWGLAIGTKEKDLRAGDANGSYDIALMYRDLLKRNSNYRTWVLKTLEINPDHGNAGKDAEHVFGMIRVGDKWFSKSDYDMLQKKQEESTREMAERMKKQDAERAIRRNQEIAERTTRLLDFQAALRTSDAKGRDGAIESLGEEIKKSLDLGFALAGVDILTNMNEAAAIMSGLDSASKSEFIEVRQLVYSSLAWRAAQNDVNSQVAYDVLAAALKTEKMKEAAQTASTALVENGGKEAIKTLIAALDSNDTGVCEALMGGLKNLTQKQFLKKEEWRAWWAENKGLMPEKVFENASVK